MKPNISLILGATPMCDRCATKEAEIQCNLPTYGQRGMCKECVVSLIERGLKRPAFDNQVIREYTNQA